MVRRDHPHKKSSQDEEPISYLVYYDYRKKIPGKIRRIGSDAWALFIH